MGTRMVAMLIPDLGFIQYIPAPPASPEIGKFYFVFVYLYVMYRCLICVYIHMHTDMHPSGQSDV